MSSIRGERKFKFPETNFAERIREFFERGSSPFEEWVMVVVTTGVEVTGMFLKALSNGSFL